MLAVGYFTSMGIGKRGRHAYNVISNRNYALRFMKIRRNINKQEICHIEALLEEAESVTGFNEMKLYQLPLCS